MVLSELLVKIGVKADTHDLERVAHGIEGIKHRLDLLALYEIGKHFVEMAEQLGRTAEQLNVSAIAAGLTVEQFQALRFSATQAGVSGERFAVSLTFLSRQLTAAKQGSKQAQALFARLGIAPEQLASFTNSRDALLAIADAMQGIDDPAERASLATHLLGRGAASLLKYMKDGSAGIKTMEKTAYSIGAVASSKNVERLEEATDALEGFQDVIRTFWMTALSNLAPSIIGVTHAMEKWLAVNSKLLQVKLEEYAELLAFVIGFSVGLIDGIISDIQAWMHEHKKLVDYILDKAPELIGAFVGLTVLASIVEPIGQIVGGLYKIARYARVFKKIGGWLSDALVWIVAVGGSEGLLWLAGVLEGFSPLLAGLALQGAVFLASLGLPEILAIGAALWATYKAIRSLYQYFVEGKPFRETNFGKDLTWLLDTIESVAGKFDVIKTATSYWRNFFGLNKEAAAATTQVNGAALAGPTLPGQQFGPLLNGMDAVAATQIAATPAPLAAVDALPAPGPVAQGGLGAITIQTTVNLNGATSSADEIAKKTAAANIKALQEHLAQQARETKRAFTPAMAM